MALGAAEYVSKPITPLPKRLFLSIKLLHKDMQTPKNLHFINSRLGVESQALFLHFTSFISRRLVH